jgi:hypothetical protein
MLRKQNGIYNRFYQTIDSPIGQKISFIFWLLPVVFGLFNFTFDPVKGGDILWIVVFASPGMLAIGRKSAKDDPYKGEA